MLKTIGPERWLPFKMPVSNRWTAPCEDVAVWGAGSLFVQAIAVPLRIVIVSRVKPEMSDSRVCPPGAGAEVAVEGTGVFVGAGVFVAAGRDVAVGDTGVLVAGADVAVAGGRVAVGGGAVGTGVAVAAGAAVGCCGARVAVGAGLSSPLHAARVNVRPMAKVERKSARRIAAP